MTPRPAPPAVRVRRLGAGDRSCARALFALMAEVFEEPAAPLGDAYLDALLARPDFWAVAAVVDGADGAEELLGGITAHALPMTRAETSELFLYDVAVRSDWQRRGVGRRLLATLRAEAAAAGIHVAFVPADDDDDHALAFYRALGGDPSPVTIFTFSSPEE